MHQHHWQWSTSVSSFFSDFSYELLSLKKCADHIKSNPTLSPILMISTIPFFWFYYWTLTHQIIMILCSLTSWSYISFWFSGYNLLVTIFGIVHRPCRYYFIIVNKSPHCVHSFALVLWLYLHQLPYWEMQTDHVNNASTLSKRCLAIFG